MKGSLFSTVLEIYKKRNNTESHKNASRLWQTRT